VPPSFILSVSEHLTGHRQMNAPNVDGAPTCPHCGIGRRPVGHGLGGQPAGAATSAGSSAAPRAGTSRGAPRKTGGRVRRAAQAAETAAIAIRKQAVVYQTLPLGTPWPVIPSSAARYSGIDTAHRNAMTARYTPA